MLPFEDRALFRTLKGHHHRARTPRSYRMSSSVPQRTRLRQPETFTGFAKLPPELRLMIWEFALDRSRHTVHVYPLKDNTSSNRPDPKPSSKTRCEVRHETTSECDEKGKDRGMWGACTESREIIIMTKTTKGIFKSYFDNRFTARLTSILNADIMYHLTWTKSSQRASNPVQTL
ncbi:Uncharacterized protein HZ326_26590 [Fusarium oxysporum f. sp. albedinis]|nr:Uncharacterized protein HZ326_26590 [Fusarium oxysporum f. sp. albedinis]